MPTEAQKKKLADLNQTLVNGSAFDAESNAPSRWSMALVVGQWWSHEDQFEKDSLNSPYKPFWKMLSDLNQTLRDGSAFDTD